MPLLTELLILRENRSSLYAFAFLASLYWRLDYLLCAPSLPHKEIISGDVNDDGSVNALDRAFLARYIAKWAGYTSISNETAADVNCDGNVNALDRAVLARHIAKWGGYGTLPYSK